MRLFAKLVGQKTTESKLTTRKSVDEKNSYRSVQINTNGEDCCQAARDIADKKFLSVDVPMLPLRDCDVDQCQCTYQRFDDRRTDIRRTSDITFDVAGQFREEENRSDTTSDRRRGD